MIKAATLTLGLSLIFAGALPIHAQLSPSQAAEEEAVRRQEATRQLHLKLFDAQAAQRKGDLSGAAKIYEEAIALFPRIGVGSAAVEKDKRDSVSGLVQVRLQLARLAQGRGDLVEAEAHIERARKVDPKNETVLAFKRDNDRMKAAQLGNIPDAQTLSRVPEVQAEKTAAATLVQSGKLLFELGKLEEAEAKFKQALKLDPSNQAATYYLNVMVENRFTRDSRQREYTDKDELWQVEKAWVPDTKRELLPMPNPLTRANLVHTSPGRQQILQKLDKIRLNEVFYDGIQLAEVLKKLRDESVLRDPDKKGINFGSTSKTDAQVVQGATPADAAAAAAAAVPAPPVDINTVTIKITPAMTDLRMSDVLDLIVKVADQPIKYTIEEYGIMFSPKPPEAVALYTRVFKVNPNTFIQGLESVVGFDLSTLIGTSGGQGGGTTGGSSGSSGGQNGQQGGGNFSIPRVNLAPVQSGGAGGGVGAAGGGAGIAGGQQGIGIGFVSRTNSTLALHQMVVAYFTAAGVDLLPPKAAFFNDRAGTLMVRASLADIEIIQTAIEVLNIDPAQVTIETKIAEVSQDDSKALGFDWYLGNVLLNNKSIGAQGGTAPSYQGTPSIANPSGFFPGPGASTTTPGVFATGPGTLAQSATDNILTPGLRNTFGQQTPVPTVATISGILTDPQFRAVIHALEQRSGADVLSAPKVTTESGRQAQIEVLDLRTIVTGTGVNQGTGAATPAANNGTIASVPTTSSITPTTSLIPLGQTLDVIPSVSADGFSIQMTLIPSLVEFLGYDDPGPFLVQAQSAAGSTIGVPLTAQLPLPRFRLRQVTTSVNVWDGQTVMLGGLITEDVKKLKDKVPVLGDLPFVGRLFRSESQTTSKRNLLIFVTPTIIDPAGNRIHTDEELPFAKTTIPPQPVASK